MDGVLILETVVHMAHRGGLFRVKSVTYSASNSGNVTSTEVAQNVWPCGRPTGIMSR